MHIMRADRSAWSLVSRALATAALLAAPWHDVRITRLRPYQPSRAKQGGPDRAYLRASMRDSSHTATPRLALLLLATLLQCVTVAPTAGACRA